MGKKGDLAIELFLFTYNSTRIVYSREQLLSLASSPLSKTPPRIPPEISRSIERSSQPAHSQGQAPPFGGNHVNGHSARGATDKTGNLVAQISGSSSHQNGAPIVARSPPANSSRSPGSAFNFGNGNMSPNGMNHSTSFKERLVAAQLQQQLSGRVPAQRPTLQSGSDGNEPTSSNGKVASDGANGTGHGEEQFSMEM